MRVPEDDMQIYPADSISALTRFQSASDAISTKISIIGLAWIPVIAVLPIWLMAGEYTESISDRLIISSLAHSFHCGRCGLRTMGNSSHSSSNVRSLRPFLFDVVNIPIISTCIIHVVSAYGPQATTDGRNSTASPSLSSASHVPTDGYRLP